MITKSYYYTTFYLFLVLILLTSSCGNEVVLAPTPSATPIGTSTAIVPLTDIATLTPTATVTPMPTSTTPATPTDTPSPEPTTTPTEAPPTPSPTPSLPTVRVEVDLNVRAGPGTGYDRVGLLTAGSKVTIIGRNDDYSWWQIAYPEAPGDIGWIAAAYGTATNTEDVALVAIPPTPTPAEPTPTPIPTVPPIDFVIVKQRLWSNEENGGFSPNGTVNNCGYGHEIYVTVIDAAGRPLDGVVISDTYNNPQQITGSIGPGRAQYLLYFNGYNLFVAEDPSAGRPVTSETSHVLSGKDAEIPIPWLIEAHYCANEAECLERISKNSLCQGHYSYDLVFQRQW
jgi:hypothetical protein